ncbi:MAG: hypothetical protein ACKKL5_01005 [Candidatus Komeilibacteria bacterium]
MLIASYLAGAWLLATSTNNIATAFLGGLASFYLLSLLPHIPPPLNSWWKINRSYYHKLWHWWVKELLWAIIFSLFILTKVNIEPTILLSAAIGALLPGLLIWLYDLTHWSSLEPLARWQTTLSSLWLYRPHAIIIYIIQISIIIITTINLI